MNKYSSALFVGVFYAAGFGMLLYGLISTKQSIEVSNWRLVAGKITNLSLRKDSHDGGTLYEVKVEYRYFTMGQTYTGSRLAFGYLASSDRQIHQAILNKLERASSVNVRYDPQNPQVSALSFGVHHSIKSILTFAIAWLGFVSGFIFISFEHRLIRLIAAFTGLATVFGIALFLWIGSRLIAIAWLASSAIVFSLILLLLRFTSRTYVSRFPSRTYGSRVLIATFLFTGLAAQGFGIALLERMASQPNDSLLENIEITLK